MGRVYDVRPDTAKGELSGKNLQVLACTLSGRWFKVPRVVRVELDHDSDSGPATVSFLFGPEAEYDVIAAPAERRAARASIYCLVAVSSTKKASSLEGGGNPFEPPVMVDAIRAEVGEVQTGKPTA